MAFYAHTKPGAPEQSWEPLHQHLAEVAAGASTHAAPFGAASLAAAAGLLHDLGKYSPAFQARLHGAPQPVDHATAGALWATKNLPPPWGRLLAHIIAGHHTGLRDNLFAPEGRLATHQQLLAPVLKNATSENQSFPETVTAPHGAKRIKTLAGFQLAFLTRMVFSCLIDADRNAAAAFDSGEPPTNSPAYPTIETLHLALQAWMATRNSPASQIDRVRAEVLRTALSHAPCPPGEFTLTVPTGGGKTLTSLAFALAHACAHALDRVIVVIPFTSIIEQTAEVFRNALGANLAHAVLEHHSAFDMSDEAAWANSRTGPERLKLSMQRWDSPIVVTTAVQFFESLFSNRPSQCRKLHSLARTVIVVDEAQTMPLPLLRPCVAALRELVRNYKSSVVLCTATQPALSAPGFKDGFENPVELAGDNVAKLFTALRRVRVRDIGVQNDVAIAARLATHDQALCIVNQRAHAKALFASIKDQAGARHLSTCMHAVHRSQVLADIRADLKAGRPCRVISTSLIEAGVDVDFPLVLRASAGLDQIAQAAGRCNREAKARAEQSEVLVFESPSYAPVRQLMPNAEIGAEMLRLHQQDPLAPEAIEAFFNLLYWRKTEAELDKGQVLAACSERANDMNFPFESIAKAMRFIDDAMVPLIIPTQEASAGAVHRLIEALRFAPRIGGIARDLSRYGVGIPRQIRAALIAARLAEVIRPAEFGDQFVVLLNLDLYSTETGLTWDDISYRRAESLIVA